MNKGQIPGEGKYFLPSRHRVSELYCYAVVKRKKTKSLICEFVLPLCQVKLLEFFIRGSGDGHCSQEGRV